MGLRNKQLEWVSQSVAPHLTNITFYFGWLAFYKANRWAKLVYRNVLFLNRECFRFKPSSHPGLASGRLGKNRRRRRWRINRAREKASTKREKKMELDWWWTGTEFRVTIRFGETMKCLSGKQKRNILIVLRVGIFSYWIQQKWGRVGCFSGNVMVMLKEWASRETKQFINRPEHMELFNLGAMIEYIKHPCK